MENGKRNFTVLGSETEFEGVLEFTDDLKICGRFNGTISAEGNLEIDKAAVCSVDTMSANSIIISGTVTGNIEAKEYAINAHKGQRRKSDKEKPMVIHPIIVANILKEYGYDDKVVAAGYLHDTVEDTVTTIDDIEKILEVILKV